jgi:predicted nucleotidyltransferase
MDEIALLHTTGDPKADDVLRGTIGLFEMVLPGRVAAYYLVGSYVDGTAIPTSDLDLFLALRDDPRDLEAAEVHRGVRVGECCDLLSPIEIRPAPVQAPVDRLVIRHGVLLYGEDVRDRLPLPSAEEVLRWMLLRPPRTRPNAPRIPSVVYPLEYPDPEAAFLGYTARNVRTRDGVIHEGTHDFVNLVLGAAECLVLLGSGQRPAEKKAHVVARYREAVGDGWAEFVAEVYARCRDEWHYLIPGDPADRRQLRALCERALSFENHTLAGRRACLLAWLRGGDPARQRLAAQALGVVLYADAEVRAAFAVAGDDPDPHLRQPTAEAIQRLRRVSGGSA